MKRSGEEADSINLANTLMLLSRGGEDDVVIPTSTSISPTSSSSSGGGRVFECKTCDRQFPSFQALGGHRASHKKLKIVPLGLEHGQKQLQQSATMTTQKKPKVHECPICGLEFSMGQALGGHMRRHRTAAAADQGLTGGRHGFVEKKSTTSNGKRVMLDLNLPPLEEDIGEGMKLGGGLGLGLGLGLVCR